MRREGHRGESWLVRLERRLAAEDEHPLPWPMRGTLTALSLIYHGLYLADRLPYRAGLRRPIHPGAPVVSVGNLAVGGTGKTPFTIWLANRLRRAGLRPVIISHAYRASAEWPLVVSRGNGASRPPSAIAGDEAALAALSCPDVPVVAARDRVEGARLAVSEFAPDLLIVDDAFQHWRLARDLDLVLLDAAKPFGNGRLLPRGRLREPKAALKRAGAVLFIGKGNAAAADLPPVPIHRAEVRPATLTEWEAWRRGQRHPLAGATGSRVAAFCGLARPERFYDTLSALGLIVTARLDLPDHTAPGSGRLREWLRSREEPVITTEKDAVKLDPESVAVLTAGGRGLLVLGVELVPEDEDALLAFIRRELGL